MRTKHQQALRAQAVSLAIQPTLKGLDPDVQGAILADLMSIWLAGHAPQLREELFESTIRLIRKLIPVQEKIIFGDAGHPGGNGEGLQ